MGKAHQPMLRHAAEKNGLECVISKVDILHHLCFRLSLCGAAPTEGPSGAGQLMAAVCWTWQTRSPPIWHLAALSSGSGGL